MHTYKTLGGNIRRLRVAVGLTQSELAERSDLSLRYEQDLESGLKCPSVPSLLRIRKTLGCCWDDLLARL
jgi:transcriptional regulator with XRE-family HTH domain